VFFNVLRARPTSSLAISGFNGFCARTTDIFAEIFRMSSTRPSLEEEKRRELVLTTLTQCGVHSFDEEVVETLTRWIAQESKAALQDKRAELATKGISSENVSQLILESAGIDQSRHRV
jgi:hypothetical protein